MRILILMSILLFDLFPVHNNVPILCQWTHDAGCKTRGMEKPVLLGHFRFLVFLVLILTIFYEIITTG